MLNRLDAMEIVEYGKGKMNGCASSTDFMSEDFRGMTHTGQHQKITSLLVSNELHGAVSEMQDRALDSTRSSHLEHVDWFLPGLLPQIQPASLPSSHIR